MFKHLRDEIRNVKQRDPAARGTLEVLLCYPGFHALLFHRISHWLWRKKLRLISRFISTMSRSITGIEIHPGAKIGKRVFIDHGMGVVIGETAEVGNDVTLYHGVTLGGVSLKKEKRHPTIEDGVLIGTGAKVLGPFTVGKGAQIGANSVVVREVEAGTTVVGIPAFPVNLHNDPSQLQHDHLKSPVQDQLLKLTERLDELERENAELKKKLGA
jgi:serine O-acetyltransferase